jgi:cytochrome c biogenesis protein
MSDNVETLSSEDWTVTQDRVELPPSRGLSPWKFTVAVVRRLWRWLTSMRTALMLLFLLAIAAIPGSLLPQQNTNPEDVTAYYAAHPKLAPIVSDLSGFGVFGSPWFSAIYLLLFISLVGCLVPRLKVYFQAVRRVPPDAPSRLTRMPVNATDLAFDLPVAEAAASVRSLLRSRRYRTVVRSRDDGTITVSGEKGYLKEAGNLLFHFSLMALLIGVAYGSWYGWHGDRLLVSGTSFCSTPAEFNDYSPGARVTPARLEPFCVTLNSFDAAYTSQGEPQLYRANATYTEGSSTDAKPANIEVNAPLRLPHANVYLIGHGYAPIVKFTDKYGKSETITEPYLTEDGNDTSQGVDTFPDLNINPLTGTNVDPKTYQKDQIGFAGVFVPTAADGLATSVFPAENNPLLVLTPYQGDLGLDNGAPLPTSDYRNGLPPRTAPARPMVDAASWAPTSDRARAIVAATFQQRLVTVEMVEAVLAQRRQVRRHRLIAETARDAAGGSESISELDFLQLCRSGRLPEPARQTLVIDVSGRSRHRDAYFPEWHLHVEVDGAQHKDVASWWADMQRQNEMWVSGDRVLRFPASAIRHDPQRVIAQIRAALIAAGWRPN